MNFKEKLTSLLENEKFIDYNGTYSHDYLKKLFIQKISENLDIFIRETSQRFSEQEIWSFVNFLSTVYENISGDFSVSDKEKLVTYTKKGLYNSGTQDDVFTSLLKLLSLLPPEKTELIELSNYILIHRKVYTILEALTFDLSESLPNEKIFLEVFLTTLNTPRGNYLGLAWHEKFWEIIAKHPDRKWFFDQLLIDTNKDAANEFLAKGKKAGEALLNSLIKNKITITETISFFRDFFTKLSPERTWYGYESHKAKELLELVLSYAQKNNISFNSDLPFLFNENTFWHTEDILAQYISEKDILEFYEKVGFAEMHIIRLYEAIKFGKREDKEVILKVIEGLSGFSEKMREVEIARENGKKQSEASTKKFHEKIKREIREWSKYTNENEISPRLLEYFFREDFHPLFKGEYREEAIKQLNRFLGWKLFSFDGPVYQRVIEENGKIEYRGGYWYGIEFFTGALETALKLGIKIKTPKIRASIIRGLLLENTSELEKLYGYLGESIADKEVNILLTALEKGHISNARYHLSGQNIFPVFEKYKKIFLRKKHRARVIELFKSIMTDEDFEEWRRASPLDYIKGDLRKELLPWLKSQWEDTVDKKRNYIETFDQWGIVLKLNTILIQENDDETIRWRLKQLESAKVKSLSFDDRRRGRSGNLHFRGVSDIESELDFDRTIIKGLKEIDAKKYQKELFGIIKHGLNLLKEEEGEETKLLSSYARYLISGVFSIESFIHEDFIALAEILIKKYSGEAKKIGLWSISNAKQNLIEKIVGQGIINQIQIEETLEKVDGKRIDNELSKKEEELRLMKEEVERYEKKEEFLNKQGNIIIFIEGFTGVQHLEEAWKILRGTQMPFKVENGFDADHIKKLLSIPQKFSKSIIIGIFDLDPKGISRWHGIYGVDGIGTYNRISKELKMKECMTKKLTDAKNNEIRYCVLLPHLNILPMAIGVNMEDAYFNGVGGEQRKEIRIAIEEMYQGIDTRIDTIFFKDGKLEKSWEKKKSEFLEKILTESAILKINMRDLFVNFEPLFAQIENIIDGKI